MVKMLQIIASTTCMRTGNEIHIIQTVFYSSTLHPILFSLHSKLMTSFQPNNNNSVALDRERTISTERPPLGELVATFAYRGCRVISAADFSGNNLSFLDRSRYFSSMYCSSSTVLTSQRIPFRTHYFSENLVASGIEPGSLDLYLKEKFLHFSVHHSIRWSKWTIPSNEQKDDDSSNINM
jgi:hypothetical protein